MLRGLALCVVLVLACATPAPVPTPAPSIQAASPAPIATPPPPPPERIVQLVPVTNFTSALDDVRLVALREAIVPISLVAAIGELLPGRALTAFDDEVVLREVRRSRDRIALVPAERVDPSVKTLRFNGLFFWDRALDPSPWPLTLRVAGEGAAFDRTGLWEMLAAGEIIFGRGVNERIATYGGDARRPFAKTRELTRAADLAMATLESPLSGTVNRWCDACAVFGGPVQFADAIVDAGFDFVTLATNHIGDRGPRGVLDTIAALDERGLAHAGAGADERAARRHRVVEVRGVRVAFLGVTDVPPLDYGATATDPGNARLPHDDPTYAGLARDIAAARTAADLVVVMPHWGIEYEDRPRPWIVAAAHAMVDAGADLVLGDHPHWVQSVELYRGKYIAYSLGNFVFDQNWSVETLQGSLHRLFFHGTRLVSVRILPTLIEDQHQPRLVEPGEVHYRLTLDRIWKNSSFGD